MENNLEFGQVKISTDVISSIVSIAIEEIEGSKVCSSFVDKVIPKNTVSKIFIENNEVTINEYVNIKYGLDIIETVTKIQENIATNVNIMTGLTVKNINITVNNLQM